MAAKIPQVQNQDKDFNLFQSQMNKTLTPILNNPINYGILLTDIVLGAGSNTFNHTLNRQMQGWFITDVDASASIYRTAPFNNVTLTLTSSAGATISLWVF